MNKEEMIKSLNEEFPNSDFSLVDIENKDGVNVPVFELCFNDEDEEVENKYTIEEFEKLLNYRSSNCFDTFASQHAKSVRVFIDWLQKSNPDKLNDILK